MTFVLMSFSFIVPQLSNIILYHNYIITPLCQLKPPNSLPLSDDLLALTSGFDRTSLRDPKAEDCIIELVKKGHTNRILLSHDAIGVWLGRPFAPQAWAANWYPTYIHKKLIPKMKEAGVTDEQINTMLVDNPRRLLTGE